MREIEFRAFDKDSKNWYYGSYFKHIKRQLCPIGDSIKENDIEHLLILDGFADWNLPRPIQVCNSIISESVGQFIGINDCDNRKIFEGDFISINEKIALVVFQDCSFKGQIGNDYITLDYLSGVPKIVGNSTENPELMELINA